jgi:cytochrome b
MSAVVRHSKWLVVGICCYEITSITSGKMPPITTICERHPWLAPVTIGALALHLYWRPANPRRFA